VEIFDLKPSSKVGKVARNIVKKLLEPLKAKKWIRLGDRKRFFAHTRIEARVKGSFKAQKRDIKSAFPSSRNFEMPLFPSPRGSYRIVVVRSQDICGKLPEGFIPLRSGYNYFVRPGRRELKGYVVLAEPLLQELESLGVDVKPLRIYRFEAADASYAKPLFEVIKKASKPLANAAAWGILARLGYDHISLHVTHSVQAELIRVAPFAYYYYVDMILAPPRTLRFKEAKYEWRLEGEGEAYVVREGFARLLRGDEELRHQGIGASWDSSYIESTRSVKRVRLTKKPFPRLSFSRPREIRHMKLLMLRMLLSVVFPMPQAQVVQVAVRKIGTYIVASDSTYTFRNITDYAETLVDNLIDLVYITLKLLFVIIVMSFTVVPVLRIIRRVRSR